jgi:hypothetical protein
MVWLILIILGLLIPGSVWWYVLYLLGLLVLSQLVVEWSIVDRPEKGKTTYLVPIRFWKKRIVDQATQQPNGEPWPSPEEKNKRLTDVKE